MSRVGKNVVYNLGGQLLLLLLSLIAVKFIYRQLGGDALGIVFASVTFATLLVAVTELGISSVIVREISARFSTEPVYIQSLVRTASLLFWALTLLLAIAVYGAAPLVVERWIHLQTLDSATATGVLRVMTISSLLVLPRALYTAIFRGFQRMEFNNVLDVAINALQQAGIVVIIGLSGGLYPVAYWYAGCFVLGIVGYLYAVGRLLPWRALLPAYSGAVIRRNLAFSWHMMWISALAAIHTQQDKVVVSKLLPAASFGSYSLASGVVVRASFILGAVAQAAFPRLAELHERDDRVAGMSEYRRLHDLLSWGMLPVFAGIVFAAIPLYAYLFGAEVGNRLVAPTALLCAGYWMNATLTIPYTFSLAVGRPDIAARANFLALFVVLPSTVLGTLLFGLAGAAAWAVVYHLFAYGYTVRRICSDCLRVSPLRWYQHVVRIAGLGVGIYGLAWIAALAVGGQTLAALAVTYLVGTAAFLVLARRMIGGDLRSSLVHLIRLARPRAEATTS